MTDAYSANEDNSFAFPTVQKGADIITYSSYPMVATEPDQALGMEGQNNE